MTWPSRMKEKQTTPSGKSMAAKRRIRHEEEHASPPSRPPGRYDISPSPSSGSRDVPEVSLPPFLHGIPFSLETVRRRAHRAPPGTASSNAACPLCSAAARHRTEAHGKTCPTLFFRREERPQRKRPMTPCLITRRKTRRRADGNRRSPSFSAAREALFPCTSVPTFLPQRLRERLPAEGARKRRCLKSRRPPKYAGLSAFVPRH